MHLCKVFFGWRGGGGGGGGGGVGERSYSTCISGIEKALRNKLQNVEAIYVTVFRIIIKLQNVK